MTPVALADLVDTSAAVAGTSSRNRKIELLTGLLRAAPPTEARLAVAYLSGAVPQGKIGVGPALLREVSQTASAAESGLSLQDVDRRLQAIADCRGAGSGGERRARLGALMAAATAREQPFLARLLIGELRQGALEGVMVEAMARAAGVPAAELRRAVMLAGDMAAVAGVALGEGRVGLQRFKLEVLKPIRPMLAQTADDVSEVLERHGTVVLEHKLDGARVQLHKRGEDIRIFTRRLHDVTVSVPELVEVARQLPAERLVLDGEVLALGADGKPQPFQVTMRRFGRKLDVDRMRAALPLQVFFFDCLHHEGQDLIDLSTAVRGQHLAEVVPGAFRVPRCVTGDEDEANAFFDRSLAAGHEGIMAKALDAAYEAGSRGSGWIKLKPSHTLDLVVLAAEWGSGRRRGWLSNLHLGARDPESGEFVMLGKTFKGMSDEMLAWQTVHLSGLREKEENGAVTVRPKLVVEVAFNEIQESPQYPAGMALRFARVKDYRLDKNASEADTVDTVRAIFENK